MIESVCQFGAADSLVGILTQPEEEKRNGGPVVVLLSAGLLHRVGPFRLYISLARELARCGVSSLRFDLSGIGDSGPSKVAAAIEERTLADIAAAYDYLQDNHGVAQFVVGGLCSGADDAFRAALADQRVVGSFQLDGLGYRTKRYYRGHVLKHYLPRLASSDKWKKLAAKIGEKNGEQQAVSIAGGEEDLHRLMPSQAEAKSGLAVMAERGQQSLLIYTGGASSYYNYPGQIYDNFPELRACSTVNECFMPKSDHTFMLKGDREKVLAVLSEWYASCWPAAA